MRISRGDLVREKDETILTGLALVVDVQENSIIALFSKEQMTAPAKIVFTKQDKQKGLGSMVDTTIRVMKWRNESLHYVKSGSFKDIPFSFEQLITHPSAAVRKTALLLEERS